MQKLEELVEAVIGLGFGGLNYEAHSVTMSTMQPNQPYQPQQPSLGGQPGQGAPTPTMFQPTAPQYPGGQPVGDLGQQASAAYQMMATPPPVKQSKLPVIIMGLLAVLVVGLAGFGIWAFGQRQDYKNNSDQKAAAAAEAAKSAEATRKDAEFIEKEKQPYKTYTSPSENGSVKITYPKTWSAYVDEENSSTPVNGYWHPNVVPGTRSETSYALRVQVTNREYAEEVRGFDGFVRQGKVKVSPYTPKNVSGVAGSRVEGEITKGKQSVMVIMPLRDKTIKIWTESPDFVKDLDGVVLENLTFTP
jgi:cytoskeletal protein RodZ